MTTRTWLVTTIVALLAAGAAAHAGPSAAQQAVIDHELAELGQAAHCKDPRSPWRVWCSAAAWATGSAGALPRGKALVGVTVRLERGKSASTALRGTVTFAALAIGTGGNVRLTDVTPSNPDEARAIAEAIASVALVFKGKAKQAALPAALAGYIQGLSGKYKVTRDRTMWSWAGADASWLREVGNVWVVIEVPPAGNGIFATVLTDAWK